MKLKNNKELIWLPEYNKTGYIKEIKDNEIILENEHILKRDKDEIYYSFYEILEKNKDKFDYMLKDILKEKNNSATLKYYCYLQIFSNIFLNENSNINRTVLYLFNNKQKKETEFVFEEEKIKIISFFKSFLKELFSIQNMKNLFNQNLDENFFNTLNVILNKEFLFIINSFLKKIDNEKISAELLDFYNKEIREPVKNMLKDFCIKVLINADRNFLTEENYEFFFSLIGFIDLKKDIDYENIFENIDFE